MKGSKAPQAANAELAIGQLELSSSEYISWFRPESDRRHRPLESRAFAALHRQRLEERESLAWQATCDRGRCSPLDARSSSRDWLSISAASFLRHEMLFDVML